MKKYKENPKTKGSGIICCIPQRGRCPNECADCFFQSGRSYLDIEKDLPNIPTLEMTKNMVVRMNDGNDSNFQKEKVMKFGDIYDMKFYNTAIPVLLEEFKDPVVLTINPGEMTDKSFYHLDDPIPKNLMFVRIRTNTWNIDNVVIPAVKYYTEKGVPVVLTFMAYYTNKISLGNRKNYEFRKRTLNSYHVIIQKAWKFIMDIFSNNKLVYSCGKDANTHPCKYCGNCLREYFSCMERLKNAT